MYSNVREGSASETRAPAHDAAGDRLEDLLDDPHCRHLLEYLRETDGAVTEATLARHVVARITNTAPTEVTDEVERRVQTWLHHGQLPVLDEYGVVEFDPDAGEVTLGRDDAS